MGRNDAHLPDNASSAVVNIAMGLGCGAIHSRRTKLEFYTVYLIRLTKTIFAAHRDTFANMKAVNCVY
jgi:hypothetical protein